jgi:hypothetical protein
MKQPTANFSLYWMITFVSLGACIPKNHYDRSLYGASRTSSIFVAMPDKLKALIGPGKITGYSLSVTPSNCEPTATGTKIDALVRSLDAAATTLTNERLEKGCDYTLLLSLGKLDASATKIEQVYLTNDSDGHRTNISADQTHVEKILVSVYLSVTDAGKRDLGIDDQGILVSSTGNPLTGDYDWKASADLTAVDLTTFSGESYGSAFYTDVMTHTPASDRDFQSNASTHVHETTHGLNNVMRNKTRASDGFFYFENGKGIYVVEPKENLRDVKNHIGASFRQMAQTRYDLYLVEQTKDWTNTLYIFDEWNAYVSSIRTAVEVKKAGKWDASKNSDPGEGVVDFMYFCSASLLSIKNVDPDYLKTNKQFKAAFAMIMEESIKWHNESKKDAIWSGSAAWKKMDNFRTAADAAEIRGAVLELMGPVWTKRVLGF